MMYIQYFVMYILCNLMMCIRKCCDENSIPCDVYENLVFNLCVFFKVRTLVKNNESILLFSLKWQSEIYDL